MKLITETLENVEYITEEVKGKTNYKIRGVFLQSEIKNRNGRVYPKETLANEVSRYNKEFVEQKRAFGELGHPDGPTVNLERVSHMITKLYPDGNNFIGEAKIMDTPYGKIVKNLIDEGAKLGVSSRGMGSLERSRGGEARAGNDFYLATAADIVADPSAPQAFVEGIMEGKEWVWNNGILKEVQIEKLKQGIEESVKKKETSFQALAFAKFFKSLN